MVELTPGQRLALDQLADIAGRSNGALEILGDFEKEGDGAYIRVRLSLETAGYRQAGGFKFRDRERVSIVIYPDFPFTPPGLYFGHRRFIGHPHVQWGVSICLYQSHEMEYQPADGLFGFFERVDVWMTAAGNGTLDPDDAPLHPPVAYATSTTRFVVKADTPPDNPDKALWIGRANLKKVRDTRFDVVGWTSLDDWGDDVQPPIAAAILLKRPLATEYPTKVYDLIKLVEKAGLPFGLLFKFLRLFALYTPAGEVGRFVFGAPMRRKAEGEPLRAHLTVWEIDAEPLAALRAIVDGNDEDAARAEAINWLASADLKWCYVMEDRVEIVHRRDGDALAAAVTGKRVLLLGCGALGSAVAETLVRAGTASLCIADKALVKPGILVRQRYTDDDIGRAKATALKTHLDALGLACTVTAKVIDLADGVLSYFKADDWDLIIDATASTSVHHRLERELAGSALPIPLISMSVSAAASHGSVTVKMPGYAGGLVQIARQAKLEAFARDADHALVKAFWPAREYIKVFQPEPGCSAPTFIGSAADIDFHAAGLLNVGLFRTRSSPADQASVDFVAAPWLGREAVDRSQLSYAFAHPARQQERRYGYAVVRSEAAKRGMAEEMRRIARRRSDKVETGGLMFGEVDDGHRTIFIDSVSGPPADSKASAEQFLCGTAGTKELAAFKAKASGGSSRFVGIWHTHPISPGQPSEDDLAAMIELLHFQEASPRQVVMLIVGFAATAPTENYYIFRRNEFRLIGAKEPAKGDSA